MRLISCGGLVKDIAASWAAQYPVGDRLPDKEEIYQKLLALKKPTKAGIEAIIGNNSWTTLVCDECSEKAAVLVILGAEPDYDSATASVCVKCLRKALVLLGREA
jgi:hypothetical protein